MNSQGSQAVAPETDQAPDVVVVGAGIIGIACAHYLSKAGYQVTLIDRGTVGGACSFGNCGYVCPSHVLPLTEPAALRLAIKSMFNPNAPFRMRPQLSLAFWKWMWQFARRCNHKQMLAAGAHLKAILDSSMTEYQRLVVEEPLDCDWQQNGLLYVFETPAAVEEFSKTDELLHREFGVAADRIEGPQLSGFDAALKDNLAGAFHYPGDTSLRPDRLSASWSAKLRDQGVQILENCELQSIQTQRGAISQLVTSAGPLAANHYVIATGAWSTRLGKQLGCSIPIQPGKGYSVTMQRPARCPKYPMLFPEHKVGVTPFVDGYRLGSMMEFVGYDSSIPKRRIQQLKTSAEPYLVEPYGAGEEQTWYGWRPMTWDSLPVIGQVPGLENAFLATGHNMLGLSLAPATGRLVAELIQRKPTHIDAMPYSPARF